jgi:hypothetical protein
MENIITGDTSKGIKNVGELALRISRFDSYRLFTLYENVNSAGEGKAMDVSGNQKYYLVFRSPSKEIRIPEYDPKGFFEVDKVNGCILFKISKKNAEDILGMKTGGERIFHIIRTYEETDPFGKVLNVTDEVEVYHGRWGDDEAFTTFTTENKVDLLTKSLASQVEKNANLLTEYNDLLAKYNNIVDEKSKLEEERETLKSEINSLNTQITEYLGDTYDGTVLSTDTKYIAFENTLENVKFTEDQYKTAFDQLLATGEVNLTGLEITDDDVYISLELEVPEINNTCIYVYKNGNSSPILSAEYYIPEDKKVYYAESIPVSNGDVIKFVGVGGGKDHKMTLEYSDMSGNSDNNYINIETNEINFLQKQKDDNGDDNMTVLLNEVTLYGIIDFSKKYEISEITGNIGKLTCKIIEPSQKE